jgi:hypothetical protein
VDTYILGWPLKEGANKVYDSLVFTLPDRIFTYQHLVISVAWR